MGKSIGLIKLVVAFAAGLMSLTASSQSYPSRPVRVVIGFAAGGTTDILVRIATAQLSGTFKQSFVVENRPGASGNIGTEYVARSAPDGYTLICMPSLTASAKLLFKKLPFDVNSDFSPIGGVYAVPYAMIVANASPVKSVADLIALARQRPAGLNFGSGGTGGGSHLAGELIRMKSGARMTHVPYKGGAGAIPDLINGSLDFVFDSFLVASQQAKGNNVRILAITSAKRSDVLPDVPTFVESAMPEFDFVAWGGFAAPAGTERPIITLLNAELNQVLADSTLKQRFLEIAATPQPTTPEGFGAMLRGEALRWEPVMKAAGVSPE